MSKKTLLSLTATLVVTIIVFALGQSSNNVPLAQAQSFSCANVTEIPQAECSELVTLYNSTNGANWKNKTGWLTTNTPCSWYGITCSAGHVSEIRLVDDGNTSDNIYGNNLSGTIPNFNLPVLNTLRLSSNQLSGAIPNFTNLPNLNLLWLDGNQLSGQIPNFNLPNLDLLYLDNNQLSGQIPNFNLPSLQSLWLDSNQLSGQIPNFNLPNLRGLGLNSNQLSGQIPNFNLPNLGVMCKNKSYNYCKIRLSLPQVKWLPNKLNLCHLWKRLII